VIVVSAVLTALQRTVAERIQLDQRLLQIASNVSLRYGRSLDRVTDVPSAIQQVAIVLH